MNFCRKLSKKTRTVFDFRNTCQRCFNDVEFPLLGELSYGELIIQTSDGKSFYIAETFGNRTLEVIRKILTHSEALIGINVEPEMILLLLADQPNNQVFTTHYPMCPICKMTQESFNDNIRTSKRELPFVTWHSFESLAEVDKITRITTLVLRIGERS